MKKRRLALLLALALMLGLFTGCGDMQGDTTLQVAVLYDGSVGDEGWRETASHLEQSLTLNLRLRLINVCGAYNLGEFAAVFPHASVMAGTRAGKVRDNLEKYVRGGGYLFLTNDFAEFFDREFLGAEALIPVQGCPTELTGGDCGEIFRPLQQVVLDFAALYPEFADYERLAGYDYGVGLQVNKASALISAGDVALYAANRVGSGLVLLNGALLPNPYVIDGFTLVGEREEQQAFSDTAASAARLLENAFLELVSQEKLGWSLSRVFGPFGSPGMAWELHWEDATGIETRAAVEFSQLCMAAGQMPSFSLVRSTYNWFRRAESVTYLRNQATSGQATPAFEPDWSESAYGSGTHIANNGKWLTINYKDPILSYFVPDESLNLCAYPHVGDVTGDGIPDLVCGSLDGYFYYYVGQGWQDGRFTTTGAFILGDWEGNMLHVEGGYSAPVLYDLDGDGYLDLISGCGDGTVRWFHGNGHMEFREMGVLVDTGSARRTMPDVGDLNDDGIPDLVVGSQDGLLWICEGEEHIRYPETGIADFSALCASAGTWLAPCIYRQPSGRLKLYLGTREGTIFILSGGPDWMAEGYLEGRTPDAAGDKRLRFGNNCVPRFADLDRDGLRDLVCGCMEYGVAYAIDSPYYPQREALQEQVDYMREHHIYLGMHHLTQENAISRRETAELDAHLQALQSYGIDTRQIGVNQHTWFTSGADATQTFRNQWAAGLLWNDGYAPPHAAGYVAPQTSAENVIALPFYLELEGKPTMLMQNVSTLLYAGEGWTDVSARYGMPMLLFYHCDSPYQSREAWQQQIDTAAAFQARHHYNFLGEDQLMLAIAAAMNLSVTARQRGGALTLTPETQTVNGTLYSDDWQSSTGVRVTFAPGTDLSRVSVDADVYWQQGRQLYLGLNRTVRVVLGGDTLTGVHLTRVNLPAQITRRQDGATLRFLADGMMQVEVSGHAETDDPGWTVTYREDGSTLLTRFGEGETLHLQYG